MKELKMFTILNATLSFIYFNRLRKTKDGGDSQFDMFFNGCFPPISPTIQQKTNWFSTFILTLEIGEFCWIILLLQIIVILRKYIVKHQSSKLLIDL